MLEASDSQRFETERELEYVELEDRRSDNTRERRYLDEAPMQERGNSYREPYREPERYNDHPSYREPQRFSEQQPYNEPEPYRETRSFHEPEQERFREPEPFQNEDRYQEPQRSSAQRQELDASPRVEQRPRPASRRPIERPGEPLDVEAIERRSPPDHESQPLDDPW